MIGLEGAAAAQSKQHLARKARFRSRLSTRIELSLNVNMESVIARCIVDKYSCSEILKASAATISILPLR